MTNATDPNGAGIQKQQYLLMCALNIQSLGVDDDVMQIGRDSRLSGPLLLASMVAGIASQGVSIAQFGLATTPAMFMSCIMPGGLLRLRLVVWWWRLHVPYALYLVHSKEWLPRAAAASLCNEAYDDRCM